MTSAFATGMSPFAPAAILGAAGDGIALVGALALLAVLFSLWLASTRRHARRRKETRREWDTAAQRPNLWTSGARCPQCEGRGGLLEVDGDDLWFVCLQCQHRHRRETRA